MRQGSTEYFILFYFICYHVNAQFTLDSAWVRTFGGNSNLDMNGSGSHGTFFTVIEQPFGQVRADTRMEVNNHGMPQGLIDPVNAVKQAMSQTSLDINPMRISTQRISSNGGHFQQQDTMQSVRTDTSVNAGFGSNEPLQTIRRMSSSKTIFNADSMQPIQSVRHTVSQTSMNFDNTIEPSQSMQQVQQSSNLPDFRNIHRGFTRQSADSNRERSFTGPSADRNRERSFTGPSADRLFRPVIASLPGAFDLEIPVQNTERTKAPQAQTTVSPTLKLVAKEIKEATKGKGIAYPKPLCIQLPDPVYNTLCLMRTEEANRISNKDTGKQTGKVKETFTKAANLVSIVAQGMCSFCCHVTGTEQERCIKMFCETNPSC
uniref:Uncharacterized protein LOC111125997 isoform X5 n=1 Tax=Crassostrea virginica TaxID=6565 RepID=A0A8B8DES0_CRAVI|nr:uncharacterized protein LOC111125997 isoform X5 [Crassostrea virginica]